MQRRGPATGHQHQVAANPFRPPAAGLGEIDGGNPQPAICAKDGGASAQIGHSGNRYARRS